MTMNFTPSNNTELSQAQFLEHLESVGEFEDNPHYSTEQFGHTAYHWDTGFDVITKRVDVDGNETFDTTA